MLTGCWSAAPRNHQAATGALGTSVLPHALTAHGRSDVAHAIATQPPWDQTFFWAAARRCRLPSGAWDRSSAWARRFL